MHEHTDHSPADIDISQAAHFLTLLDEEAEFFTFQTFSDNKSSMNGALARVMHGTLEDCAATLTDLNRRGAGIFVTVNRTNGKGRTRNDITGVRAVWQEDDGDGKPLPLTPHIVVESSPGKYHRYLLTDDLTPDEHRAVEERLIRDYGSDPNAKDLSRVMRLPGFRHQKGDPHLVRIVDTSGWMPYTKHDLLEKLPPIQHTHHKRSTQQTCTEDDLDRAENALKSIPPDDRDTWLSIGMALQSTGAPRAFDLWCAWSRQSDKYDEHDQHRTWLSFGAGRGLEIGTLFTTAMQHGWRYEAPAGNPGGDTAPESLPDAISADQAVIEISRITDATELKQQWRSIFERIDDPTKQEINELLDILVSRNVGTKRPLQQDWAEHRRRIEKQRLLDDAQAAIDDKAGDRYRLNWDPEHLQLMVHLTEQAIHNDIEHRPLFRYAGRFCRIDVTDPPRAHAIDDPSAPPPKVVSIAPYERTSAEFRIRESVAVIAPATERKPERLVQPPQELVTGFLETPAWDAPTIEGLEVHPLVLASGKVLQEEGLHRNTGLYLDFGGWDFHPLPDAITQEDARWAREAIAEELFGEYQFAQPSMDISCAVALVMTGFSRRLMAKAPAFLVTAARQGSGKTTLCQMAHIINTGSDLPVISYNPDENEAQKTIFASLRAGVHTMCFDNIHDGATLGGTSLAAIITSGTFVSRVLGESTSCAVPTNVLILGTGNNIGLDADLARRVITVRLSPSDARPEQKKYAHPDVYAHCLSVRRKLILAMQTIVAGYMRAGSPQMDVPVSGMTDWDRLVRHPLIWAGGEDPIEKLEENRKESPVLAARSAVAIAGRQCFGDAEVSTAQILRAIAPEDGGRPGPDAQMLRDAVDGMSDRASKSVRSLGKILSSMVGHIADGVEIRKITDQYASKYVFRKLNQ